MFTNQIQIFRLFGFRVNLDISWFLIAALLVWSLAIGYFPRAVPGLDAVTYWWMGLLSAFSLFASIVLHECAHALVARRYGLPISGITLFIFGGVAEMNDEPGTPGAEFWVAIAGPIASFLIAGVVFLLLQTDSFGAPLSAVIAYLATINVILALFNLLPAYPLDGGRILRALLWWWKKDISWATRIAAVCGAILALILIALGVINIVGGAFLAGLWQMVLGVFLYSAAGASRFTTELRHELKGVRVAQLMNREPVAVDAELSIRDLVDDYFYRYHFKLFPVVSGGRLVGCVRLAGVNAVGREYWENTPVRAIMSPCGADAVIGPEDAVIEALKKMHRTGNGRLVVAAGDCLQGIITNRDIMDFVAVRLELGEHRDRGSSKAIDARRIAANQRR